MLDNQMTARVYIDEKMPDGLDKYDQDNWINHDVEKLPNPPNGYIIVRSGRTKEGDILGSWVTGWNETSVLTSPKYNQVLNCEVNHFKGVARKRECQV